MCVFTCDKKIAKLESDRGIWKKLCEDFVEWPVTNDSVRLFHRFWPLSWWACEGRYDVIRVEPRSIFS